MDPSWWSIEFLGSILLDQDWMIVAHGSHCTKVVANNLFPSNSFAFRELMGCSADIVEWCCITTCQLFWLFCVKTSHLDSLLRAGKQCWNMLKCAPGNCAIWIYLMQFIFLSFFLVFSFLCAVLVRPNSSNLRLGRHFHCEVLKEQSFP